MRALVENLADPMLSIDGDFEVRPQINKTISKIFRDTRFSKDKSLFKDRMWLVFKRANKEWKDAPGYFFEITPTWYRFGMGYYQALRATMDLIRADIDDDSKEFEKAIKFFAKQNAFELYRETYKRQLKLSLIHI